MATKKATQEVSFTPEQMALVQTMISTAVTSAITEVKNSVDERNINHGAAWVNSNKEAAKGNKDYDYGGHFHCQCPHCEEVTRYGFWLRENKSGNKFPKDRGKIGGQPRWRFSCEKSKPQAN